MINVLMALHNGVEFLEQSFRSLKSQTISEWSLLIGINGHSQSSNIFTQVENVIQGNSRVLVLDLNEINGKSQALNRMAQVCSERWVAVLDVDDYWHPTKLERQVSFMRDYDVIGTLGTYCGDRSHQIPVKSGEITLQDLRSVNMIINSSAILKREHAWWDPDFEGVEDYDLWARLALKECKMYNVPQYLTWHRLHIRSSFNTQSFDDKIKLIHRKLDIHA